ncbi:MAG: alpha-amylase family glycosyl hydrolase [Candidatus Hodarchaeota archaeon]
MDEKKEWWHKAVIYQIYPRSFADSTNNGIGDLQGIINHISYLKNLGIDGVWLSPIFPSPQKDFGYDITDYTEINPEYGTMDDFDELLTRAHSIDIKIILDLVLNHTSEFHPWFLESKSSRTNPKHDWYVWKDGCGRNGKKPPNNWQSAIGGLAWEWNEQREQYYLHQFFPYQPDLNWHNPEVQAAMLDVIKFWLDKGVDGFRLDLIHALFEDIEFRNNPRSWRLLPSFNSIAYLFQNYRYSQYLHETIDMCIRLREFLNSYTPERILIGEIAPTGGPKNIHPFYGNIENGKNTGLHLIFNFKIRQAFSAKKFRRVIQETEKILHEPYWPCYSFSNHDFLRMISYYGNSELKARLLTLLLLTLRGTPIVYYGEEIGMRQVKIPKNDQKDPLAHHRFWGIPVGRFMGRDGCRTPMQWNSSPLNAGFSSDPRIKPWLPISPDLTNINVNSQKKEEKSMLTFYQRLVQFRKHEPILKEGMLELLKVNSKDCLVYKRYTELDGAVVFLNFKKKEIKVNNPYPSVTAKFSTYDLDINSELQGIIKLQPFEGLIVKYFINKNKFQ